MSEWSEEELAKSMSRLAERDCEGDPERVARNSKAEHSASGDTELVGAQCPLGARAKMGKDLDPMELARAALPGHCQVAAGPGALRGPVGKVSEDAAECRQKFLLLATLVGSASEEWVS